MNAAVKRFVWNRDGMFDMALRGVEKGVNFDNPQWVQATDYEAALSLLRQARDVCSTLAEYDAGDEIPPHLTEAAKEILTAIDEALGDA